jgi:integral membrane protein
MNTGFLRKLRLLGMVEGTSTLLLFGVAMPLKYLADLPLAVTIVGSIHGLLFVALAATCLAAVERVPIGPRLGLAGIVGAVVPFGPFVVDVWLRRLERQGASDGAR